jgi:hypothetical protein
VDRIIAVLQAVWSGVVAAYTWVVTHKTYFIAVLTAIHAVSGFLCGQADANRTLEELLIAAGLFAVRHGIAKTAADRKG